MKKNIAEKMIAAYEKISKETDLGVRVAKLDQMEKNIKKICKVPKAKSGAYYVSRGAGALMAGIVGVSGALMGGSVAAVAFVGVVLTGFITVVTYSVIDEYSEYASSIDRKVHEKMSSFPKAKYMKNVVPHLPRLKELSELIDADKKNLLNAERVDEFTSSKKLTAVLKNHPELAKAFSDAKLQQPQPINLNRYAVKRPAA